jgi:hypothetical protein
MGGFLEPIGHFERKRTVISVTKGIERDKRNPSTKASYVINHPILLLAISVIQVYNRLQALSIKR